ncbi:hypothetical protein I5Q34_05530 [Streptomyces sp. AV19]|nr:hypothetical protein [Streptomyces sp. AV19]
MVQAGCPRDGRLGPNYVCTSLSNGAVFHNKMDDGNFIAIHSSYEKRGGGRITAKLGYSHRGNERWGGWHDYSAGQSRMEEDRNYDFAFLCEPTIGLLKVDGQGMFQTPMASC